jgi:DNA-binding MarR family transcriptional regulator
VTEASRWLDDDEQRAWRALIAVLLRLPAVLERQLHQDADLTHFEYFVLALLSEAEARTLRLSHLAAQADASLSRLSHVITRLERRGLVRRTPCPDERRATNAVLTDDGMALVLATAPGHVSEVRRRVFDALGPREIAQLERICSRILARIDDDPAPRSAERGSDALSAASALLATRSQ